MTAAAAHRQATAPSESPTPLQPARSRPALTVLDRAAQRRRQRHRLALGLIFVVLLSGLFLVALVHAQLVANQQELDEIRNQINELEAERSQIERAVDEASSPAAVVARAEELGMVRAEEPVYLPAIGGTGGG